MTPEAPAERPSAWVSLWRAITRFERAKIQPTIAFRNAIGITIPLAIGVATGAARSGLTATTGALNVSFMDSGDPYVLRGRRMLASTIIGSLAVAIGALCGRNDASALLATALWGAGAGLMVAVNAAAADIGVISLVTLIVFSGQPMEPEQAMYAGLLALAGGLLQTGLAVALWPVRPYEPERRALAALFTELAHLAGSSVSRSAAPPASTEAMHAQQVISGVWRGRSVQGKRYVSLLTQAERLRLALMTLIRLHRRLEENAEAAAILETCFEGISKTLRVAAEFTAPDRSWIETLDEAARRLPGGPLLDDARHQLDAISGQLRAITDLAVSSTAPGRAAFDKRESSLRPRFQLTGALATLRANLTLRSAAMQHAIRLSVCLSTGLLIARSWHLGRAYWVPMTIAIVLKPDFTATFSRGAVRVAGTFLGLVLSTLLFHFIQPGQGLEVLLVGILAFLFRWAGPANYGLFVVILSGFVVLLFSVVGIAPQEVIAARGLNTVIGGSLALLAYALWPTWERSQVSQNLALLLDAYRRYFRAIREGSADSQRNAGRLARSNLEASVDRYGSEPGATAASTQLLAAMLSSSHRLIHAMMSLEAGLGDQPFSSLPPAYVAFANDLELTLHSLAGALGGSPLALAELPNLRADHKRLAAEAELPALVVVETDRITNSTNTLSEQILRWRGKL